MSTSHVQLTAKYRPQIFAQVVGQEEICTVLSRAAAQNRIAAAYLFSGTRGVGKTTLARIFAKAINCQTAPTPEPCNQCRQCRQIAAGSAVDVAEIDGASNRGIDQVRRLKEDIGYAPLEGRYKIIIIDEAHMLTKEAFNALLKTLEEPPPGVTFIMASTEPQKFPATIISRCQHYVFKRLNQAQLETHLRHVLELEGRPFEPEATALLAKRAAGSVRDGMSLLEQVLIIGNNALCVEDIRRILGLAGGELFQRLLSAIRGQDCIAVSEVLRVLLDQGLDLGFFLRELAALWRNLFLLRQAGSKAFPLLEIPDNEAHSWLAVASELSPTYIHAAWQLTLEGQRQVLTSLEPAQSLEMLLLNLTYLPRLLRLEDIDASPPKPHGGPVQAASAPATSAQTNAIASRPLRNESPRTAPTPRAKPCPATQAKAPETSSGSTTDPSSATAQGGYQASPASESPGTTAYEPKASGKPRTWEGFLDHYETLCRKDEACLPGLRQVGCSMQGDELVLRCSTRFQYEGLHAPSKWRALEQLLRDYFGTTKQISLLGPQVQEKSAAGRGNGALPEHPIVREFVEQFQAKVVSMEPRE